MKRIWAVLAVVSLIFSAVACNKPVRTDGKKVLVIASDATWPPMEYVDENGDIVGFDVDLIKAAGEAAGFEVKIQNTAWDGIFAGLGNGAYDAVISSVTITDERKAEMDFSVPYINAGQVIIVKAGSAAVTSLNDLAGKKVGAQIGTTGDMAVEGNSGVTRKSYDEIGLAVEDLINGNIDAVVCDSLTAVDFVMKNDAYKGKLVIAGEPFTEEFFGIAVKKGNTEVLDLLNKGLKAVIENGTRDQLVEKWLR
jgi:polar amino acid transport system substrate-binding protein